ncbi:uncharacterized protein K444DRAFT_614246 [Hyaloscypha bicolor E]|uniref:Uncharacterized protein n=1 Tax=Hyaloscypha bicolor E TaxID=1095630 RepID=A0A2J6T643_9HELO|nr:uncharacterized protein K444DRAFT_614246 [Hyaloscypha bicolor E]PMD58485.1 hypothetical protein K444DRAFT_614246 [Hyaloscypha bicolor E]
MDQRQFGDSINSDARLSPQGRAQAGRPVDSVSEGSEQGQPPTAPYEQNQSGTFWHHQVSFQEPLPYAHSPVSFSSPSTSSVEQSALGEPSQWFPTQNSFSPQTVQGNPFASAYIWPENAGDDVAHSHVGPTVTHHLSVAVPSSSKRKRELDSPTQVLLPYSHKDWHLVPQSSSAPYGGRDEIILCSRCNIYESLFGVPGFCSSCLQVSFNTWPSALGSRNENLESLVLFLMPAHMEEVLSSAPHNMPRSRTWRLLPQENRLIKIETAEDGFQYRWSFLKRLVMSTQLFSDGFEELANIAQVYQLSLPTKSKSLETCCTALISVCELYNTVVGVPTPSRTPLTISIPKLISNIRAARITVRHAFQQYQKLAASPSDSRDRQDWIPAFLSASILAVAAIVFLDILVACPSPYKEQIWGEAWTERIAEMRNGGYGMLIGLLRAYSGEVNPLKMECWGEESPSVPFDPFINATSQSYSPDGPSRSHDAGQKHHVHSPPKKRSKTNANSSAQLPGGRNSAPRPDVERERNILLGFSSPAALQGMLALKEWNQKYGDILKQGDNMFSQSPLQLAKQNPLAALFRIFELR